MGMKCVKCGTDNDLRDRTTNQGRCKSCNHPFVFEPSAVTDTKFKFTDPFFAKVINDISDDNRLYFTPKQLFYLLDRRLNARVFNPVGFIGCGFISIFFIIIAVIIAQGFGLLPLLAIIAITVGFTATNNRKANSKFRRKTARILQVLGGIILIAGMIISLSLNSFFWFVFSVILGMSSIYLGYRQLNRINDIGQSFFISQSQFDGWINRWKQINTIEKMLPFPREESTANSISTEISAYSFDQVVICDNAAIAQMLIANNFHFENSCAVLSITGYPESIFSTVLEMLRRNPDLKVYALHDASPRGVSLVHNLRTSSDWFLNSNTVIYDLGLLPRQVFSSESVFIRNSTESAQAAKQLPEEVRRDLTSEELKWLDAGNFVELESFSPQRIMRVANQGIAKSQAPDSSDSLILIDSGADSVYVVETFG
jgi:DNA-directed RNA polymerase subunit RPC12/RpoP